MKATDMKAASREVVAIVRLRDGRPSDVSVIEAIDAATTGAALITEALHIAQLARDLGVSDALQAAALEAAA